MKYKEFVAWCNDRACDGRWGLATAIYCIDIMHQVKSQPFWKRERKWQELNADGVIEKGVVIPVNRKITEIFGQEESQ